MEGAGLSPSELAELREAVKSRLSWDASITDEELRRLVEAELFRTDRVRRMTAAERAAAVSRLFHSFRGLDALQPLLDDPAVTEIMINGHRDIFVEKDGELMAVDLGFESRERLEDLIQSIVGRVNRIVNEASPIVDARLPDGSRVHVVLPPVALKGPTVTIRRFPRQPLDMNALIARRSITAEAAEFLRLLVKAKYNLFISGGTGSGKTTFLNALSQWIPEGERVITIEDAAELQLDGVSNLVSLETRNANTEGKGRIGMRDLIRASLRMRPNRIIVGEVRGEEALDMLQAMNTGHEGSLSTGHSNGARDMISRLETMVLSGADLPVPVVRQQMAAALDVIVHLSRFRDRTRRVEEICEVAGYRNGEVELRTLFRFEEQGEQDGVVLGGLVRTAELSDTSKLRFAGLLKESAR
ncbi:CpaF family protein [Cohnella lubricantis]|uniref:CpaF family protein n=1 Tax=Cohnella lubricantis TaxID=2163172 RepID=A0A841T6Z2_9BACL|nr:CpaF family protein [Cohnella lubricantis]MBB6677104.1 CpaF family protein [Cohnella lubricantis]MBP2118951.1 pilus assembly protein CpaF [Cohnella lubricantis]